MRARHAELAGDRWNIRMRRRPDLPGFSSAVERHHGGLVQLTVSRFGGSADTQRSAAFCERGRQELKTVRVTHKSLFLSAAMMATAALTLFFCAAGNCWA